MDELKWDVYFSEEFRALWPELPGVVISESTLPASAGADLHRLERKVVISARRFTLAWFGARRAIEAEREFYSATNAETGLCDVAMWEERA